MYWFLKKFALSQSSLNCKKLEKIIYYKLIVATPYRTSILDQYQFMSLRAGIDSQRYNIVDLTN